MHPDQDENFDIEALLTPIPGDSPTGTDVASSEVFGKLSSFRQTSEWDKSIGAFSEAVRKQSKHLDLATALGESMGRQRGLAGIEQALLLLKGLIERFWPDMYPRISETDLVPRAISLEKFDRLVGQTIAEAAVTEKHGEKAYALWQLQHFRLEVAAASNAVRNPKAGEKQAEKKDNASALEEAKRRKQQVDDAIAKTSADFYQERHQYASRFLELVPALRTLVDQKFRQEPGFVDMEDPPPSFSQIGKLLEEFRGVMEDILESKLGAPFIAPNLAAKEATKIESVPEVGQGWSAKPRTRNEAIRQLKAIADFFRETEPHSPVAYLVARAARWGEMPLDTWLEEVVTDNSTLKEIKKTLGIETKDR